MFCTEAMFSKENPPNLHLNASGAQSRTLTSEWGFPRQSFFLINIFFNQVRESDWSARYSSANQNVSPVPKERDSCHCVPFSLVQRLWSQRRLHGNCVSHHLQARHRGTTHSKVCTLLDLEIAFFPFWLLLWEINPEFNHGCLANTLLPVVYHSSIILPTGKWPPNGYPPNMTSGELVQPINFKKKISRLSKSGTGHTYLDWDHF